MRGFTKVNANKWRTTRAMRFVFGKNKNIQIYIDTGFETDFATIPFPLSLIYPKNGKYAMPAMIHDKLYASHEFTKITADAVFYQAMRDAKVCPFTRTLFFVGVMIFGWLRWNKNK